MNSTFTCPPGKSCGNPFCSPTAFLPCFPGLLCPANSAITPCPSGEYCPDYGLAVGSECAAGHWCPQYSKEELPCNVGSYCPAGSEHQVQWFGIVTMSSVIVALVIGYFFAIRLRNERRKARSLIRRRNLNGSMSGSTDSLPTHQHKTMKKGVTFSFENVQYSVKNKLILKGITADIKPGQLTGIMGPSGAGKTTLMSVLAGKISHTGGTVCVNGVACTNYKDLRQRCGVYGFVPQDDVMHDELSPKEVLLYNAALRLPAQTSPEDQRMIVDDVLGELDLYDARHTIIGTVGRGISLSQRKRVNIGMELVAQVDLLWLDEPTTGLDASSAQTVCQHLKSVAATGVTVVAVLHQPRNEIFEMLDHVILLAVGGRTAYAGPPSELNAYLENLGLVCPEQVNISDYMMDVVSGKVGSVDLADAWAAHEKRTSQNAKTPALAAVSTAAASEIVRPPKVPFFGQFLVFLRRTFVLQYRVWDAFLVNLAMRVLAGLTVGIAFAAGKIFIPPIPFPYPTLGLCPSIVAKEFCEMPIRDDTPPLNDYCIMAVGLVAMASAVRTFGRDRAVAWREASVGVQWFAQALAKWLLDIPFMALYSLCFSASLLAVSSLQGSLADYWLVFLLVEFCVFGFGYCLSAFMRPKNAILVGVIAALSWVVCDGSSFAVHDLGVIGMLSYPRWAAEAIFLTAIQYDSMTSEDQQLMQYVVDNYKGWKLDNYGNDIGVLIALGCGFRVIHAFLLWACNRDKRR